MDEAGESEKGRKHWDSVAQCWHLYASPLRPCAADQATFRQLIDAHGPAPLDGTRAAIIFGVTPEIATMDWPGDTIVTGFDRAPEMIEHVWPGNVPGRRQAICADWFNLPRPARPYDLAFADGSVTVIGFPGDLQRLIAHLKEMARPDALLVTRTFTRPLRAETIAELEEVARAGRAGTFHAFKFRLAMSLQERTEDGISLHDIWALWHRLDSEIEGLSARNGWRPDVVGTIALFRGKQVKLVYPSREELIDVMQGTGLKLLETRIPTYEMGDRCPIMAWRL